MAVGRVTAGILPLAKRGEERAREERAVRDSLDALVGSILFRWTLWLDYGLVRV